MYVTKNTFLQLIVHGFNNINISVETIRKTDILKITILITVGKSHKL